VVQEISGRGSQGDWRQNKLTGGKRPVSSDSDSDSDLSRLSQMRAAVVRSEKLVAEPGGSKGTQRKGNVRCWKPLPSDGSGG
jgi:hypothetical protein